MSTFFEKKKGLGKKRGERMISAFEIFMLLFGEGCVIIIGTAYSYSGTL